MNLSHHYNYDQTVSYPHGFNYFGEEGHFLANPRRSNSQLYSPGLLALDRKTQANINRLREKLVQIDPCYGLSMEHWHQRKSKQPGVEQRSLVHLPSQTCSIWENTSVVFTNARDIKKVGWTSTKEANKGKIKRNETVEGQTDSSGPVNKLCYLCTTLEEHQRHIARRGLQLKKKKKPKPRVQYIPPPPVVHKKIEETEEKSEVMYKVTVRTAKRNDSGTSANVHLTIHGRKGLVRKRALTRKRSVRFCFGSGSEEVFHFRGPEVGELRYITIEHDGVEKKHSWLLQEVEILVARTEGDDLWTFPCGQWLSLHLGDFSIKRDLRAQRKERIQTEYEVRVVTGRESMSGTDANVFLTVYGKKGASQRFPLKSDSKTEAFQRGAEDVFHVVVNDIGPVSSIKIEHDDTGRSPSWLLEKVELRELTDRHRHTYTFPCGDWLTSEDDEEGSKTFRYLYPLRRNKGANSATNTGKSGKTAQKDTGPLLSYNVKVLTGDVMYAGTDARVFITMHGKLGKTREIELTNSSDCFEKGQTDIFNIQAADVGDIKKLVVRHDNSGLGAGWFLEEIVLQRFFSKSEITERLQMMKSEIEEKVARHASKAGIDIESPKHSQSMKYARSVSKRHTKFEEDSDSESDKKRKSKNVRWKSKQKESYLDSEDSDNNDRKQKKQMKVKKDTEKKVFTYGKYKVIVSSETDTDDLSQEHQRAYKRRNSRSEKRYDSDESDEDDYKTYKKRDKEIKKKQDSSSNEDSEDTDKEDRRRSKRGLSQKNKRGRGQIIVDSENEDDDQKHDKIPKYDEYIFPCHRWLAEDEDDGQISRTLKPKSVTTFYTSPKWDCS